MMSGILTLATLPVETMTTRKMPSGLSGLSLAEVNGMEGLVRMVCSVSVAVVVVLRPLWCVEDMIRYDDTSDWWV